MSACNNHDAIISMLVCSSKADDPTITNSHPLALNWDLSLCALGSCRRETASRSPPSALPCSCGEGGKSMDT